MTPFEQTYRTLNAGPFTAHYRCGCEHAFGKGAAHTLPMLCPHHQQPLKHANYDGTLTVKNQRASFRLTKEGE